MIRVGKDRWEDLGPMASRGNEAVKELRGRLEQLESLGEWVKEELSDTQVQPEETETRAILVFQGCPELQELREKWENLEILGSQDQGEYRELVDRGEKQDAMENQESRECLAMTVVREDLEERALVE